MRSISALVSSLLKSSWISAEYVFGPNFYLIAHRELSARPFSLKSSMRATSDKWA
jgi:hypothetical protein